MFILIKFLVFFIGFLIFSIHTKAETCNETWQKEIIDSTEFFVLAKVINNLDTLEIQIETSNSFVAQKLSREILINGFYPLQMTSVSEQGVHLNFEKEQTFYFLKKRKDGNLHITYRPSYHQTLVPQNVFERTYTEIWNFSKIGSHDEKMSSFFVTEQFNKNPAVFIENEKNTLFLQYVALETAYLQDMSVNFEQLKK